MKKNIIKSACMFVALAAAALTSCSKGGEQPVPVRFTSTISPVDQPGNGLTRAVGETWTAGDKIGVYMFKSGTLNTSENAYNKQYVTIANDGKFTPVADNEIYFPVDGSKVDFIAYYPYKASIAGIMYTVNLADQSNQEALDLMYSNSAIAKDKNSDNVELAFTHKLSKVVIVTVAGTGLTAADLAAMTVNIKGMNTAVTFDLITGERGTGSISADIAAKTIIAGERYEAVVLPATFASAGSLNMEFALNNAKDELFTWRCPAGENFEPGKVYEYTMTIARTGVTFTCTIIDWTTVPRTGTVE